MANDGSPTRLLLHQVKEICGTIGLCRGSCKPLMRVNGGSMTTASGRGLISVCRIDVTRKEVIPILDSIWGWNETRFSGILAQSLAYSSTFFRAFAEIITKDTNALSIESKNDLFNALATGTSNINVTTERLLSAGERADIYIEIDGIRIAIEAKLWADFQPQQLQRYQDCLEVSQDPYLLILLTPSWYNVERKDLPVNMKPFTHITIKDVAASIKKIRNQFSGSFEQKYMTDLIDYLEVIDVTSITQPEVDALLYSDQVDRAHKKLRGVLGKFNGALDNNAGQYILSRIHSDAKKYDIWLGFRFGKDWYYSADLLSQRPEAIVYIKDTNPNPKDGEPLNTLLRQIKASNAGRFDGQVDYYERKDRDECRFSIRKSLAAFTSGDLDEIELWLQKTSDSLKQLLQL